MKIHQYLFYCIIFLFTISCNKNIEQKPADSIKKIIESFPQLKTTNKLFGNDYQLVKSVRNGKFDFEIQLYSEPDTIEGKQQIIVIVNSQKECCAIPFFSNKYKDYWKFPFDKQIPNIKRTNSNFNYELNAALKNLGFMEESPLKQNGDIIYQQIVRELFTSVLNCISLENLQEKDSTLICGTFIQASDMPHENWDLAGVRLRENYKLMKKQCDSYNYTNIWGFNCYFDKGNGRLYQINFERDRIDIKNYRQDVGYVFVTM